MEGHRSLRDLQRYLLERRIRPLHRRRGQRPLVLPRESFRPRFRPDSSRPPGACCGMDQKPRHGLAPSTPRSSCSRVSSRRARPPMPSTLCAAEASVPGKICSTTAPPSPGRPGIKASSPTRTGTTPGPPRRRTSSRATCSASARSNPATARIEINPQLGPLTVVHGTIPTIRGPVKITAIQKKQNPSPRNHRSRSPWASKW